MQLLSRSDKTGHWFDALRGFSYLKPLKRDRNRDKAEVRSRCVGEQKDQVGYLVAIDLYRDQYRTVTEDWIDRSVILDGLRT